MVLERPFIRRFVRVPRVKLRKKGTKKFRDLLSMLYLLITRPPSAATNDFAKILNIYNGEISE